MRTSEATKGQAIPVMATPRKTRPGGKYGNHTTYSSDFDRINANVFKTETCWLWTGFIDELGYGRISSNRKDYKAHRLSYQTFIGPIPPGMCVLHRCDVRNCANPEHLFLGSQLDNIKDMVAKNRHRTNPRYGTENPMSKVNDSIVRQIRAIYADGGTSQRKVADQFGLSVMTVNRIVNRKLWGHVK